MGFPELIARNEPDYIEIADRLIRNPELRAKHSAATLERFRAEFLPASLGSRYVQFLSRL